MELIKNEGAIKAIDKTTVHRICSGQVVLNLATAIKELIENSLDAGATVIDVKLKEYGSDMIEVADNGYGVKPSNFEGLTLKHHTSKIQDFSDLVSVETFGFRGEALSSLCALSELSIITRHESENCGTALYYDRNGHIINHKPHARQVGTTVTLTNLFSALPVRQKEFLKNVKREFNKMSQLLSAYCLVSQGVKITCVNQTKNNARTTFLCTQGCKTIKENISCIFGAKQLTNLLEIKQKLPTSEVLSEMKMSEEDCSTYAIEGYISSCGHGFGRGSTDRQFYFINSRPCEPTKVMKQVNEVYHQYNANQYPFVFLNTTVSKGCVDVNVTPDKRTIFLTEEKLLLAIIKASLLDLFHKIPSTFAYNNVSIVSSTIPQSNVVSSRPSFNKFDVWRHKSDGKRKSDVSICDNVPKKQMKTIPNQTNVQQFFLNNKLSEEKDEENETKEKCQLMSIEKEVLENSKLEKDDNLTSLKEKVEIETDIFTNENHDNTQTTSKHYHNEEHSPTKIDLLNINQKSSIEQTEESSDDEFITVSHENITLTEESIHERNDTNDDLNHLEDSKDLSVLSLGGSSEQEVIEKNHNKECNVSKPVEFDEFEERNIRSVTIPIDLDYIKKSLDSRIEQKILEQKGPSLHFRANIDPSKNKQAEIELTKEISKDMFEKMEIIGQFNLGFILSKLDSDIFIIDQHATDEKYNFETLQQTTVISNQKLVAPQVLELTAVNECIVMENISVFNKNGFEFKIDENAQPTKRISLTAVPMSKNWVFGKDDIDELIFMLQDSPGANCRPSRVRAMFASRACRKSVMIGTALTHKDMKRLVSNMGTIEQPWNCPHGRPTMRHLVNLNLISSDSVSQ